MKERCIFLKVPSKENDGRVINRWHLYFKDHSSKSLVRINPIERKILCLVAGCTGRNLIHLNGLEIHLSDYLLKKMGTVGSSFKKKIARQLQYNEAARSYNGNVLSLENLEVNHKDTTSEKFDSNTNDIGNQTFSKRILKRQELTINVRYPSSSKIFKANVVFRSGWAIIEPTVSNTAFYLIDESLFCDDGLFVLNRDNSIRITHHRKGLDEVKSLLLNG